MNKLFIFILAFITPLAIFATEYHVSKTGNNKNLGTQESPFLTIQSAANIANPGDTITVHEGIYREWVNPLRGGLSDNERIVYRAATGEKVEIKGSEVISGWKKVENGVWRVKIPNTFFKDYNPYKDTIMGDWFKDWGRIHHTGDVYLNGKSLFEKEKLDLVLNSNDTHKSKKLGSGYTWYCESDSENTTIWANFHNFNPNKELIEINVRKTCIYPSKPGINYITISGFDVSQAATQWAAPTAEQIGMIATHWNKGWIIENNKIHDSRCSGITLGKEKSTGHNVWLADPSIDGSVHYLEVTFNALRAGWNKKNIGSHIVRNNEIYNCEQTGICGSFGAAFSIIENNHIHHIWTKRQFAGAELAGVKIHGGIDLVLRKNRVNDCGRGYWLDWMTQGVRISQNLMYNNDREDMYFEVNHGPYLVDNNILLSKVGLVNQSSGGAFVHNLFAGETKIWAEPNRFTPYQLPHSTEIAGVSGISSGDNRFYNNIFVGIGVGKGNNKINVNLYGLSTLNDSLQLAWESPKKRKIIIPSFVNNNVYFNGALPYKSEESFINKQNFNPELKMVQEDGNIYLNINLSELLPIVDKQFVTTSLLGKTQISKAAYENTDGSPLSVNQDYWGNTRSTDKLLPGPFSNINISTTKIKVW
ncbi:right-handed parallel beta-helix repeat-containing protein [Polaribacter sp. SA4-12]|uniref:right-handed parallel beta-helix repeat-containing protein n=1 Tax=Polaribacter sp. SA4-12 TaxID=1312072 RepID=UPI000B3D0639|nr:right-handed parallel beta-helix repeat-containing protein [Polaribacter sp. SA4-12]ARV16552.1 hypothetical protein BTO07_16020 [Polaribacter sp. SA4-12]